MRRRGRRSFDFNKIIVFQGSFFVLRWNGNFIILFDGEGQPREKKTQKKENLR
jgi:hypothetical protein